MDDFNNLGIDQNKVGYVKEVLLNHIAMLDDIEMDVKQEENGAYQLEKMKRNADIEGKTNKDNDFVVSKKYDRLKRTASYIKGNFLQNSLDLNDADERNYVP